MIARILIPIVLFSVLPYLWIDWQYLHVRKGWRKILYWLPVAIVIGYSSYLALGADFMPDDPMLIDIWFGMMAVLAVPQFVFALCSFVGWECMRLSRRFKHHRNTPSRHASRNWGKLVGGVLAVVAFFSFIYGFTKGVRQFEVKHLTVYVPDLPKEFDGYRIVHFSDIHLGSFYGWRRDLPQRDIDSINAQRADLICFTGDIQNVKPSELTPYQELLSSLNAKDGVVSVLGNHDYTYYMHIDDNDQLAKKEMELRVQNFERSCGWRLLMNEHIVLHRGKDSIYVAGTENYDKPKRTQVAQALYGIKPGQFVLMLQHIPTQWKEMLPSTINEMHGSRDSVLVAPQFTLSGHTHAGQVSVLGLRPSMFAPFDYGLYEREGCQLYTTAGLGGTVPIRIGATPEIAVITLKRK